MEIAAVAKARALAIIEIDELNKDGKLRFSDLVKPLVDRFEFDTFPSRLEDFDLADKGVDFRSGKCGDIVIDLFKIFDGALYLESLSSTVDSQRALIEILNWGAKNLGLTYKDGMIRKWAYISDLIFYTDYPILKAMSSPLSKMAAKTSAIVEKTWGPLPYEPIQINIGHDPTARKHSIAGFTIQHRANTQLRENKYFSEAPLPTDLHIKFLEEFERDVMESVE